MLSKRMLIQFIMLVLVIFASCSPVAATPSNSTYDLPTETQSALAKETPSVSVTFAPTATPILSFAPEANFESCGKGEPVSATLTTVYLESFFSLQPKELLKSLGTASEDYGFIDDLNTYCIFYENPGISLHYTCDFTEELNEQPILPLNRIIVSNFQFRGLSESSNYDDLRLELGNADLKTTPVEDTYYYALRYKVGILFFDFISQDKTGSDGLGLEIVPVILERAA